MTEEDDEQRQKNEAELASNLFTEGWTACQMGEPCNPPSDLSTWESNHWIRGWDQNFVSLRTAFDREAWNLSQKNNKTIN